MTTLISAVAFCTMLSLIDGASNPNMTKNSISKFTSLESAVRWQDHWVKGRCDAADYHCMNQRGLRLINKVRKKVPVPRLKMGTEAMLDNAMDHSRKLAKLGKLEHQAMGLRICRRSLVGENVAVNHVRLAQKNKPTDPTRMCTVQFKKSPSHYANMIKPSFTHFVMGIFIADDGYIWCTQTFWRKVRYGRGKCAKAAA